MELGTWKPVLSALVLPPAGPLLLAAAGVLAARRWRRLGGTLVVLGLALLWLLSCHAVGALLARGLLPQFQPIAAQQLQGVGAIVVLGGGVQPYAPEYGAAQPSAATLARLRYGARLARASGKPLAFSGGVGWAAAGTGVDSEGEVARRVLLQEWGITPRWVDDQSRDTRENAQRIAALLAPQGARSIALVTDAVHMPRALHEFAALGLQAVPAPTQFPAERERGLLEWLPSGEGLALSRHVLRERLALTLAMRR